jgi:hypothetical protein
VQKAKFARRGVLRMTVNEQLDADSAQRMSSVLWDLFSGSASYTDVFLRTLHPKYIGSLTWNLVAGNVARGKQPPASGGSSHVQH